MLLMYIDVSLKPVSDPFLSLELRGCRVWGNNARDRGLQWIQLRSAAGAGGFQPMVCHQIFCQLQLFGLFSRLGTNPFPSSLVFIPNIYKLRPPVVQIKTSNCSYIMLYPRQTSVSHVTWHRQLSFRRAPHRCSFHWCFLLEKTVKLGMPHDGESKSGRFQR